MKFLSLLLFVALLASPAFGASQVEALRSQSAGARAAVNAARSEQMAKTLELNRLSGQIEELKAKAKGKLLPGSELDAALKQSQELSGALTVLAQTVSAKESELEQVNLALLSAMTDEMRALKAEFDRQPTREGRAQVIAKMKALKAEREQVRAAVPAAKVPALSNLKESDDPAELLEQVDQLRDEEDRIRAQMKAVEARIAEARAEREMDARMRQFVSDDNLFDEQDRRLRVRHETFEAAPPTQQPAGGTQQMGGFDNGAPKTANPPVVVPPARTVAGDSPPPSSPFGSGAADSLQATPSFTGSSPNAPVPNNSNGSSSTDNLGNGLIRHVTQGSDARPAVGKGVSGHGDDDDDLDELEVQRARLKGLADQLKAKAAGLQKKAAELK